MQLQLIKGTFTSYEALDLLEQLVHIKIKFHEQKIDKSQSEEDIKMREKRIKEMQDDLKELRSAILSGEENRSIEATIFVN
jgi:cob(I)alamin adenosyltransferase